MPVINGKYVSDEEVAAKAEEDKKDNDLDALAHLWYRLKLHEGNRAIKLPGGRCDHTYHRVHQAFQEIAVAILGERYQGEEWT